MNVHDAEQSGWPSAIAEGLSHKVNQNISDKREVYDTLLSYEFCLWIGCYE